MGLKIYRAWRSRNSWRLETEKVVVTSGGVPSRREQSAVEPALQIGFAIDTAGGGASRVVVSIPPDHFVDLVRAIMRTNRGATLKALDVAREAEVLMGIFRTGSP